MKSLSLWLKVKTVEADLKLGSSWIGPFRFSKASSLTFKLGEISFEALANSLHYLPKIRRKKH
jgi:hypothetical protein